MKHKLCLIVVAGSLIVAGCQQAAVEQKNSDEKQTKNEDKKAKRPPEEVTISEVKNAQLLDAIKTHKGKVVLVDFWSTTCIPCKKKFPNVVKLYDAHRDNGLVCISAAGYCTKDAALEFLKKQDSVMPNYLVEDFEDVALEHWQFTALPAYFVYGRDGQLLENGKFTNTRFKEVHYEDAEKVVLAELAKK